MLARFSSRLNRLMTAGAEVGQQYTAIGTDLRANGELKITAGAIQKKSLMAMRAHLFIVRDRSATMSAEQLTTLPAESI